MEYAKDVDVSIVLQQVRDSVMLVEKDPNVTRGSRVTIAQLRQDAQLLGSFVNGLDRVSRSLGIISGNVIEYVFKPALGFCGPGYFRHERMRRPISSFEMTRPTSESARPRSIIT